VEGVDATVAAAIRDRNGRVIERSYESRAISLGREIDHAKRIGRANHDEGRCSDKVPATAIEPVQNLAGEPPVRRSDNFP
jgi:hypothetical protein